MHSVFNEECLRKVSFYLLFICSASDEESDVCPAFDEESDDVIPPSPPAKIKGMYTHILS